MNRIAIIAATGFLALALTACGQNHPKQPPVVTDTTTTHEVTPATPQHQSTGGERH